MKTERSVAQIALCCLILGAALAIAPWSPAQAEPVSTHPPRSTPAPTAAATSAPSALPDTPGARIELRIQPVTADWASLWTVVEWMDARGTWHVVEGWRGGLDQVAGSEGIKTWWVYATDLGKGPFRWLIMENPDGKVLAISEPFALPPIGKQIVTVSVLLR